VRVLVLLSVGLLVTASACGSGSAREVVTPNGRIGPFLLGVTTERQLIARLGQPARRTRLVYGNGPGSDLIYRCGQICRTSYTVGLDGRIHDFLTTSSDFVTPRGSYVEMSIADAEHQEGKRFRHKCAGPELHVGRGLDLVAFRRKVNYIILRGPKSLFNHVCD
jgi:hypothetical protein